MRRAGMSRRLDEAAARVDALSDEVERGAAAEAQEAIAAIEAAAQGLPSSMAQLAQVATGFGASADDLWCVAGSLRLASLVADLLAHASSGGDASLREQQIESLFFSSAPVRSVTLIAHPAIVRLVKADPALLFRRLRAADPMGGADLLTDEVELPSIAFSACDEEGFPALDDGTVRALTHKSLLDMVERTLAPGGEFRLGRKLELIDAEARAAADTLELHVSFSCATHLGSSATDPIQEDLGWVYAASAYELWSLSQEASMSNPTAWPDRKLQEHALDHVVADITDRLGFQYKVTSSTLSDPLAPIGPWVG